MSWRTASTAKFAVLHRNQPGRASPSRPVLQGDFTDYETEDGARYHIGSFTEYLSRFNLVSQVLDRETAMDLIEITEAALQEILTLGHPLPPRIIVVTDNGPAMKAKEYRNFVKNTGLLVHVRGQKYHPQTLGREERYHGSLKLEHLYRVCPEIATNWYRRSQSIEPSTITKGSS